ncbi:UDP-galactose translocator-like isoform X2 [Acanthaster planci]|uniref:UDP-galactose translocator-like isoform X2 n=1 Tax=Acanthaster planci TaxID=133434 RepID=A0A8B7YVJ7_ACAPL|nr:UDP-galactose translocator-like isoform X2 [Acanthaster planci]
MARRRTPGIAVLPEIEHSQPKLHQDLNEDLAGELPVHHTHEQVQDKTAKPGAATQVNLKYVSLVLLVLQNAALILTMRYTRNQPGDMYFSTSAVCVTEVLKMTTCVFILLYQHKGNAVELSKILWSTIVLQPLDTLKVSVPAFIYTMQNNLMFIGVSNLSAATFQVSYQLKILTTALFSVVMLRKSLSAIQWVALVLLFAGVAIVQVQPTDPSKRAAEVTHTQQNPLHGLLAVVVACCFSGFAGVYFEKILKGSKTSLWIRNIQLGLFGAIIGLVGMILKDGAAIMEKGMFFGYTNYVWSVIFLQAFGGLTVAVVVKYADNILKGFATSVSIIVSTVAAVYLFHFQVNVQFCIGAGLVIGAIFFYGRPKPPEKAPTQEQPPNDALGK